MIGFLSGTIHSKQQDSIILLVGGVGYNVYLPPTYLGGLSTNTKLELFIHTQVKEDAFDLFGFKTQDDLGLYKILLNVSGIGAKTALNIIDKGATPVRTAVINADVEFFKSIPRLGTKNAQRIIIELKNKLGSLTDLDLTPENPDIPQIIDALTSMGYTKQEAQKVIKLIPETTASIEEKIRFALRNIGK